jgi:2,4-dienoyl-CoA reductase-like NADH-dependent reductase (Old Yellow Enzyme family)
MTSPLFQPLSLRGLAVPNRVMVSPMCQYSAVDGNANDWHLFHITNLANSGAGLVCIEATHVEAIGRITPGCLGLYSDENEAALARVIQSVRRHSRSALAIQIAHAGRKGSSAEPWNGGMLLPVGERGWQTVAPSALPQLPGERLPTELDEAGIRRIVAAFADTAKRADRVGFDAMELHGAHGYLIHQFLSPVANHRTDRYGGSLENRMRFGLEVFDAVRAVWPERKPLGMRVSATDWVERGLDVEQTIAFAEALKARGCDWIDVSSAGVAHDQKIPVGPGYQVHLAKAVRAATGVTTIAVGMITDPKQAEAIVANGEADMVALARGILYDPRWVWHAAAALGGTVEAQVQYWRCAPREAGRIFGDTRIGMR